LVPAICTTLVILTAASNVTSVSNEHPSVMSISLIGPQNKSLGAVGGANGGFIHAPRSALPLGTLFNLLRL